MAPYVGLYRVRKEGRVLGDQGYSGPQGMGRYGFDIMTVPKNPAGCNIIEADDEIDDWVEVGEIIVELEGKNLLGKISEFLR